MNKVRLDLANCYGIKKLKHEFDFSAKNFCAIYAQNGIMKSSLALAFHDLANGVVSKDRISPSKPTRRSIKDENGVELSPKSVLALRPYDEEFGPTEKTCNLLVNSKLRKELEQLLAGVEGAKQRLLKALAKQSKSKRDFQSEISLAFTSTDRTDRDFELALNRIKKEISDQKDAPFENVEYDRIFDDKVLAFLEKADAKTALESYVRRYNELLTASTFFKKGTFDYYNAGKIAKTLTDNGFFDAKHSVSLNSEKEQIQVSTQKELEDVISKEKQKILKDPQLRTQFDELAHVLEKNETLRDFQTYLMDNDALLSQMVNVNKFKQDILKSYLKANSDLYFELMGHYEAAEQRQKQIYEEAAKERTQWEKVIAIFKERFAVPFTVEAKNRVEVMLGDDSTIELAFTYDEDTDHISIEREDLMQVLSTGERKALYVLNIIFEIECRKKDNQETLVVVDDIADSFDYQNKYAIIFYLKEISEDPQFKLIIMTHNFDFFRTIERRFVGYPQCLMASKSAAGISLNQASGIRNVFTDWKQHFHTDPKKKIASIPFIRNLIELTKSTTDATYLKLTSLLHWKPDSATITENDLNTIYNNLFGKQVTSANGTRPMIDVITTEAENCLTADAGLHFENKIVLAIGIRLAAEIFMIQKINDNAFVAAIDSDQTQALIEKFKVLFSTDNKTIEVLSRVSLMTPENIHLNSFMYEPIVDMSDAHLKTLYKDVVALQ